MRTLAANQGEGNEENRMTETPKPTSVYAKIAAVQGALAREGIAKSRKNQTPGASYNFRGIDEVYNTLSSLLAENNLCILPRIVGHSMAERGKTKAGNAIFSVIVEAEFDFVSADDGSCHVVRSYGEAMDSSDKATNKAMSAAYKYMALMTFAIPTEGDNDADAHTPEVAAKKDAPKASEGPLSDAQWGIITDLIQQTNSDSKAFCTAFKVASVKELPAAQFERARAMLNKKLAAMAPAIDDEIKY